MSALPPEADMLIVGINVCFVPKADTGSVVPRRHGNPWKFLCETSAAPRRLDRGDVDLPHAHHRIKRALCFVAAGRQRLGQQARRDLPGDSPLVFAPAALALLAAIADDGVPVAVGLLLIVSGDLEREIASRPRHVRYSPQSGHSSA